MDYAITEKEEMMLQRQQRTSSKQHVVTNVEKMKEDTKEVGENETCSSDRREFEEGIVTSADQVSIRRSENIKKDEGDSHSLRAESKIGKGGGTLDIQNTGVSLEIPPGALRRDYCIQMRIIPHHQTELSFASNSSVVVELLPNNVKLSKPATLTLPHHLVLKKKCGWKAKGYSSHHKEGDQPQWEEERNAQCDVTYRTCGMRLYNFSWKKFEVGDDIVEAKKIILFAAIRSSFEDEIFIDIGYYWQLPSCRGVLNENRAIVLHEIPVVFYKHGQLPLTILFQKVEPPHWICNEGNKAKEISFSTVAITNGSFCTFNLKRGVSDETDTCSCFFKAGQGSDLVNLLFPLNVRLGKLGKTSPEPLVVTNVKEMKEDTEEFETNKRRLSDKRKFEEGSMPLRKLGKTPPEPLVVTNVKEMKDDAKEFGENKRRLSDQRIFEKGSLTSADKVSIHTGENIKKEGDSHSMRAESKIGKDGGTLEIPNTGVSLKIPPGALQRDYFIRMRIISHHLDETELSFASNSSVVVELLPNNVKLLIPATLTLPHCLVLKERCVWKATVYSSHHKQGNQPQWEEEINTQCDVTNDTCVMWLYNFCWKKYKIGDRMVVAKRIILYAAKRSSIENEIFLDIGYYWRLPSCQEFPEYNNATVLLKKPAVFFKEGQLPLTVLLEKVSPIWTYNEEETAQIINFSTVAITEESSCTFFLKKIAFDETDGCACVFKAGQGSDLEKLFFSLKESSLSTTEAIIPSTGNATAGDTHEEIPSAIVQTEVSAVSEESLRDLSVELSKCWMEVGRNLLLTEGQIESLDKEGYVTLREKIYQMLLVWKRKGGSAATYGVLGAALKKAERVDLKEYLLRTYNPT